MLSSRSAAVPPASTKLLLLPQSTSAASRPDQRATLSPCPTSSASAPISPYRPALPPSQTDTASSSADSTDASAYLRRLSLVRAQPMKAI